MIRFKYLYTVITEDNKVLVKIREAEERRSLLLSSSPSYNLNGLFTNIKKKIYSTINRCAVIYESEHYYLKNVKG